MHSKHPKMTRSESFVRGRLRKTSPLQSLRASDPPMPLPGGVDARSSLQHPQHNLGGASCRVDRSSIGSLQGASQQAQKLAESFPDLDGTAPALADEKERSLSETTPLRQLCAFEESTRQKLQNQDQDPPPTQLKHMMLQLRDAIATLQQVAKHLAELTCSQLREHSLDAELAKEKGEPNTNNKNNNNNNKNKTYNNNNNTTTNNYNNDNNNDTDNNKNSQEPSLNSLDLDDDNPESNSDLDTSSFGSFNPTMGVESSLGSLDQHEANLSFDNLGHQMMTIGSSLGSLDQQDAEESSSSFDQEGQIVCTAWEPSLDSLRANFGSKKPKKRVTFDEATLTAYTKHRQNNRKQQKKGSHPTSSQLEQLEHNKKNNKDSLEDELPEENNKSTTTQPCWNELQQEQKMQQQTAAASAKELEHRICNNNSLDSEEESIGSLESETHNTASLQIPKAQQQHQQLRNRN